MVVTPTKIRNAEEAGLQRNDKYVQFGYIKFAVPKGFVYLFWRKHRTNDPD